MEYKVYSFKRLKHVLFQKWGSTKTSSPRVSYWFRQVQNLLESAKRLGRVPNPYTPPYLVILTPPQDALSRPLLRMHLQTPPQDALTDPSLGIHDNFQFTNKSRPFQSTKHKNNSNFFPWLFQRLQVPFLESPAPVTSKFAISSQNH